LIRNRRTRRGIIAAAVCAVVAPTATAAPPPPKKKAGVPLLIFPVIGQSTYSNDFGAPRGQGGHEGNDIMAPRRAPAVAVEPGTVKFWTTSSRAGCMLYLYGDSGTTYLYIHLNNDVGPTNDNQGKCVPGTAYAPGLKSGQRVGAGQLIAYVGDSGDANGINPHLHFEVHPNDGAAVNPFKYLNEARRLLFAATPGQTFTLQMNGRVREVRHDGMLALYVEKLRKYPNHPRVQLDKPLQVLVPADATIERTNVIAGLLPTIAKLTGAKPGEKAIVWTEPATATLKAQLGAGLTAARVLLSR
jgi:hypothetical protein